MKFARALKLTSVLFSLLLLLVLAPLIFLLVLDPNDFKPQIETLAERNGVVLDIQGPMDWQLYPHVALELADVSIETAQPGLDIQAQLGRASLDVDLLPILSGELSVRGIDVENVQLSLAETEILSGASESNQSESLDDSSTSSQSESLVTAIEISQLNLHSLTIDYQPLESDSLSLDAEHINVRDFNLAGRNFPVELKLAFVQAEQEIQLGTQAWLGLAVKQGLYELTSDNLQLELNGAQSLSSQARIQARADMHEQTWSLAVEDARIEDMQLKLNAQGGLEPLSASGSLSLEQGTGLLTRLAPEVPVSTLALSTEFAYSPTVIELAKLDLQFNDSRLNGNLDYYPDGSQQSQIELKLDQISLDDYVTENESQTGAQTETGNPLAFLETIPPLQMQLEVDQLVSSGQTVSNIKLEADIRDSQAVIKLSEAELATGQVISTLELQAQGQPQVRILDFLARDLDLGILALAEDGSQPLGGMASAAFTGTLSSLAGDQILTGLQGDGQVNVENLRLTALNIEQSICQSAQQLGATAALTSEWPAGTQFDSFSSPFNVRNGIASMAQISSGMGNLKFSGGGEFNLASLDFDAQLSLLVDGERTSEQGCSINKYLRNTQLPLACSGNLGEDGQSSCGLDKSVIANLLTGQIQNQIQRQFNRFFGNDEDEANDSEGADETQDSTKEAVRGLLEGLFGR